MGLSIHYRGSLRNKAALPKLVEEVIDVAKIYQWPYEVFETELPINSFRRKRHTNNIYGICVTPPACETISLCFLSNGKLIGFWSWRLYMKNHGADKELLGEGVSVKTQFSGEVIHKIIIHLLDYLSKKYFDHFELNDEGHYWETRDENLLHEKFASLTGMINKLSHELNENPIKQGEKFEEYFARILKWIHGLAQTTIEHQNTRKRRLN